MARLALEGDAYVAFARRYAAGLGKRAYDAALLEHALGYPWERPSRSYVLRDGDATLLDELPAAECASLLQRFVRERHPLLAFGSNAAPGMLAAKFAHFEWGEDRSVLVLAGQLHDYDVGPAASPTGYGALPAALFHSPGTRVRAAVVLVTPAQATQLTWSEIGYRLGRLDDAHFEMEDDGVEVDGLFAYISRFGVLCPDGGPVALEAVGAERRSAPAISQEAALALAAERVLGDGAGAESFVRAVFEDLPALFERLPGTLWPLGRPLEPERWTPLPGAP